MGFKMATACLYDSVSVSDYACVSLSLCLSVFPSNGQDSLSLDFFFWVCVSVIRLPRSPRFHVTQNEIR